MLTVFRTLFGGPSQPEPLDKRGGIYKASEHARNDGDAVNPYQYENKAVSGYMCFMTTRLRVLARTGKPMRSGQVRRLLDSCRKLTWCVLE